MRRHAGYCAREFDRTSVDDGQQYAEFCNFASTQSVNLFREYIQAAPAPMFGATCICTVAVEYTWTSSADCFSRSGGGFSSYKTLACSMSWAARAKPGQALSVLHSW